MRRYLVNVNPSFAENYVQIVHKIEAAAVEHNGVEIASNLYEPVGEYEVLNLKLDPDIPHDFRSLDPFGGYRVSYGDSSGTYHALGKGALDMQK